MNGNEETANPIRPNSNDEEFEEGPGGLMCSVCGEAGTGEEGEEGRKAKGKKVDPRPSQEEVDEHMKSHIPYRSWCHHCVAGRGVNDSHIRGSEESDVPVIGMDYFYLHEGMKERAKRKEEEQKGEERRIYEMPVTCNDCSGQKIKDQTCRNATQERE